MARGDADAVGDLVAGEAPGSVVAVDSAYASGPALGDFDDNWGRFKTGGISS